jgi:hypothetical protein
MGHILPRAAALCAAASFAGLAALPATAREARAESPLRYCVVEKAGSLVSSRICKTRGDWLRQGYDAVRGVSFRAASDRSNIRG